MPLELKGYIDLSVAIKYLSCCICMGRNREQRIFHYIDFKEEVLINKVCRMVTNGLSILVAAVRGRSVLLR